MLGKRFGPPTGESKSGGSCTPAGHKVWAAVPQALGAASPRRFCLPLPSPACSPAQHKRTYACLHGKLAPFYTNNWSCTGIQDGRQGRSLNLSTSRGDSSSVSHSRGGPSGAHGNGHVLQHIDFAHQH